MQLRYRLGIVAGVMLLGAKIALAAAGITISFVATTTAQDTYIQNTLIPEINADLCAQFGLASNCTAAQLTTAGCVAVAANTITKTSIVYRNCTPFTQDAAGETALAADSFARVLIARVSNDRAADIIASCAAWNAASGTTQNSICSTLSRPNGCNLCQ